MTEDRPGDSATGRVDEALEERVVDLESEFSEMIEDVRERVIQVKRETDAKAPADHAHEETNRAIERAVERIDDLESAIGRIETRTNEGFENYEAVLEYLVEVTDHLGENVERLGRVVLEIREGAEERAEKAARRTALDRLREEANRKEVRKATCESCDARLDVSLLTGPACPHCESTFDGVEPGGLLRAGVLHTGTPAALRPAGGGHDAERADEEGSSAPDDPDVDGVASVDGPGGTTPGVTIATDGNGGGTGGALGDPDDAWAAESADPASGSADGNPDGPGAGFDHEDPVPEWDGIGVVGSDDGGRGDERHEPDEGAAGGAT